MKLITESQTRCILGLALTSLLVSGCSDGTSVVSGDGGITPVNLPANSSASSPAVDESSATAPSGVTENNPIQTPEPEQVPEPEQTPEPEQAPEPEQTPEPVAGFQGSLGFGSNTDGLLPYVQTNVAPDTEEFESLPAEVQAVFSPDCLLTGPFNPFFCYVPATRTLSSASFDGTTRWSTPLPGNNASNRIEGLEQISFQEIAIVANITQNPGEPRQEISIFEFDGGFVGTYPLFENLRELNGEPGNSRLAVNIQGEPLLSLGVYSNFQNGIDSTRLVVAGNYYRLINGGDPSQLSDWRHSGVVIKNLSTDLFSVLEASPILSMQFIPGAVISDASVEHLERTDNSVRLVLQDQTFEVDMLRLDNLPSGFDRSQPLSADALHQRIAKVLQTVETISMTPSFSTDDNADALALLPGVPQCEPDDNLPVGQTLQCTRTTELTRTQCFSGEFTDQITSERHFSPEIGSWIIWTRTVVYNQCVGDSLINDLDILRSFRNGIVETKRFDGDVNGGFLKEEVRTYMNFTTESAVRFPSPESDKRIEIDVNGSVRMAESTGVFVGLKKESSINISNFEQTTFLIPSRGQLLTLPLLGVTTVTDHQFLRTEIESTGEPDLRLSASLNASYDTGVSLDYELSLEQVPGLTNNINGFFSVLQDNGASIRVEANDQIIEQHSGASFEAVFQSAAGETTSYTFPTEGLLIPWGSTPALQ